MISPWLVNGDLHVLDRICQKAAPARQAVSTSGQSNHGGKTGKPYPNVRPADKPLKQIKAKPTALTGRNLTPLPLSDLVGSAHRSLRGWADYFDSRNSSLSMNKVRKHAEDRL
ncbi:group II intron maturase-specific domain-containing protein [Accumulibacter sp.]|uniref:group II intron maturase-specific domain-containing protein n=1 Tax=Accumulibacter sp. TaxID=2053492 RepID=UPI0038FC6140